MLQDRDSSTTKIVHEHGSCMLEAFQSKHHSCSCVRTSSPAQVCASTMQSLTCPSACTDAKKLPCIRRARVPIRVHTASAQACNHVRRHTRTSAQTHAMRTRPPARTHTTKRDTRAVQSLTSANTRRTQDRPHSGHKRERSHAHTFTHTRARAPRQRWPKPNHVGDRPNATPCR